MKFDLENNFFSREGCECVFINCGDIIYNRGIASVYADVKGLLHKNIY